MKRKTLILILILEAVLLAGLSVLTMLLPRLFSSILAFPMEQIAAGLVALSGAGPVGNGIAVAATVCLSLIPLLIAAFRYPRDGGTLAERIVLGLLTPVLFIALFGMANPTAFRPLVPASAESHYRAVRAFFALSVWTVVVFFIVLRLIRLFRRSSRAHLLKYLRIILCVLCMSLVAQFVVTLAVSIRTLAGAAPTAADIAVGVFRLAAALVPLLFILAVILRMLALLEIAGTEEQEGIAEAASRLSAVSCLTLAVTTGLCALQHVAQILLLPGLTDVNAAVDIPLTNIVFVVLILLFSRLLVENKQLRDDNSMII